MAASSVIVSPMSAHATTSISIYPHSYHQQHPELKLKPQSITSCLSLRTNHPFLSTSANQLSFKSLELSLASHSILNPYRKLTRLEIVSRSGGSRPAGARPRPRPTANNSKQKEQGGEENKGDAPLINEQIRVPNVRLIGEDQSMLGVVRIEEALFKAVESDLDLVMIAPEADPPVVRIMDYSKYRYEMQKKKREQQKKAAASKQELKELKMRYNIDTHDYEVRLRAAQRFLADGDKVKVTIQFRGREMEFKDLGVQLFARFQKDIAELGTVEGSQMEGRMMQMFFAPIKVAKAEKDKKVVVKPRKKSEKDSVSDAESDSDLDDSKSDLEETQGSDSEVLIN